MLLLLLACTTPTPVVQGIHPSETTEQITARRKQQELRASPQNLVVNYEKAEGVYIDVRYFGGKAYNDVRAALGEQLGALLSEKDLGEQGEEMSFERARLRMKDGKIYMLEVPLPEPLRRTEALGVLGFPPADREYMNLTLEFRLNNAWGFRRIRFLRAERDGEEISSVQAWKEDPT